ncbi:MAG TPA: YMGG-like glycine zipper-containing protein [Bryobacteraceae bacterium]|jgi:outer membrane lipoprotein SlyB
MKKRLLTAILSAGLLFSTASPSFAAVHRTYYGSRARARARARARYIRHRRNVRTAKRVGIGAAGGAAIGALAGGGKGAGIGAIAGAGAGALYDQSKRHRH